MADYNMKTIGDTWFEWYKSDIKELTGEVTIDGYDFPLKDIVAFVDFIREK